MNTLDLVITWVAKVGVLLATLLLVALGLLLLGEFVFEKALKWFRIYGDFYSFTLARHRERFERKRGR